MDLHRHEIWVPPGTLVTYVPTELALELVRERIHDEDLQVRHRAIALAYGLGKIAEVRDEVIAATRDPEMDVRQYALVALGTLDDPETLRLLLEKLRHGSEREATSAIWALARRPDGIGHVLPLAADPRPWVTENLLGAIAYVSAPLTDEQLADVLAKVVDPAAEDLIAHHRWRTREGGQEFGPHGPRGIFYKLAPKSSEP